MNKKIFTLFVLLLLLPVTALAAEEIKLFIGGQQITESGCYANQNGTWTKVEGTGPSSGQFYYDAATFTLTLNQAEITHDQTVKVAEGYTYEGSVIAFSQTADVSLKIVVSQGTSNITGTGGIRVESTTGNASLSIKGSGSLDVEPKGSNSGITLCSSKNTNLDIDGADVTASSPAQYGVYLISSTDATSTSTITVNNGSLTTGGNGNVGIYYYWSGTSNAGTSSLTVSGNAVVDTRNSQIMAQNKETVVQVGAGSDGNGGIVFNGKNGTVYGDVTLQEDLEIGLLGSKAYCEKHQQELPKIVNVFNRDGGPEPPVGIAVSQAMYDDFVEITKPIQKVRADIPFEVTVRPPRKRPKVAGGTDSEVFATYGVPTYGFTTKDVKGYNFNYGEIWHTERDLFTKNIPEYLEHTATVTAITVLGVANLDKPLPREGVYEEN